MKRLISTLLLLLAFPAFGQVPGGSEIRIGNTPVIGGTNGQCLYKNNNVVGAQACSTGSVTTFSAGTTGFTPNSATSGAITLAGTLIAANGGTGFASYAVGDLLYANTTTTLAKLADVATGSVLLSGGVSTAPAWGALPLTAMAAQATNTVVGNATSGSAAPTALPVGSCSTAGSALIWTTNTGFGCNTSITAAVAPASGLTGTTMAANVVTSSLTTVGTISTGGWQGTVVGATYGGTGVNNGASTITLAGNLVTSGANSITLTSGGATNVTLPTTGTLVAAPVGNSSLATMAAATIKGNNTGGAAAPTDLTARNVEGLLNNPMILIGQLLSADMNSTADQAIVLTLPTGCTSFGLNRIQVTNASTSLTTAVGGIYTATAKGGLAMGNAAQSYSALTTQGPNTSGSIAFVSTASAWFQPASFGTPGTVYLSLTAAQGGAATADFRIWAQCWA